jgi:hypothetical protein
MKKIISTLTVLLFSIIVLSTNSFAQPTADHLNPKVLKLGLRVIPVNLDSQIPGIIESSIYDVVLLKYYFPNQDFSNIVDKLNDIAKGNSNPSIRYKAQLASTYLNDTNTIQIIPNTQTYEHDYLFRQIAEQLTNKLLVSRQ